MNVHEQDYGCALLVAIGPGGPAAACCSSSQRARDVESQGCADLRCVADVGSCVAGQLPEPRSRGTVFAAARSPQTFAFGGPPGGHGGADDCGPLSRPTEVAVCPVDPRSGRPVDRRAVRHSIVGLDGGALLEQVGLHAAETVAPGVRAGSGGCRALAPRGVSGHSRACQAARGRDSLGRRDGFAQRSSDRHELRSEGQNAGHPRHRTTISLQHDLRHQQFGAAGFHGVQAAIHLEGAARFPAPLDSAGGPQGVSDCRSSSGP